MNARNPLSFLKQRRRRKDEPAPVGEAYPEPRQETSRHSIGPLLRRTRESYGYDLPRISQVLRIRYVYLEAIEQGNFERLPGPAYAVGFIRSYADFLGLDSDQIIAFYKRDVEAPGVDSTYYFPEPVSEAKVPGAAVFTVCALLAAVAYGSWYYASGSKSGVADLIPEVPDRLKVLLEPKDNEVAEVIARATDDDSAVAVTDGYTATPKGDEGDGPETAAAEGEAVEPTVTGNEAAAAESGAVAPAEETFGEPLADAVETPAAVEEAVAAEPPAEAFDPESEDEISALIAEMVGDDPPPMPAASAPESDTALPAAVLDDADAPEPVDDGAQLAEIPAVPEGNGIAAELAPEPQVYGEDGDEVRVVLRATQDSWVQVREESGKLILTRVLRPGDVYRVPDKENLSLLVGNAGGLEILVDGREIPPLGPVGVVRRDVSLNVDALLGATANVQ